MSAIEIQKCLVSHISSLDHLQTETINIDTSFDSYGLDSAAAMEIIFELEQEFQCHIDPTAFYYYSNIKDLAKHIAEILNDSTATQKIKV